MEDFFMFLCRRRRRQIWSITLLFFLSKFSLNCFLAADGASNLGINYGMVADNLPQPSQVVSILQSISVTQTRIYSANSTVLRAFANSGISVIVGIGNEVVASLTDLSFAINWVQANVASYYPATQISGLAVGNEVFTGDDTQLMANLLPAMQNLHAALASLSLGSQILVSTAHSLAVLSTSYPPSGGMFKTSAYLMPLLQFLQETGAPFMINAYPFFAYKASPSSVSLQYVLFEATASTEGVTVTDPNTGLVYSNMLDAQVDAIYSALQASGYSGVEVIVSETGWPSAGDADEAGASVENAQTYNSNLIARLASGQGTPAHPSVPIQAFIFALFNEDLKPGPTSERHYGLFNPDGTKVYDFGLDSPHSYTLYNTVWSSRDSSIFSPNLPLTFTLLLLLLLPSSISMIFIHINNDHHEHFL